MDENQHIPISVFESSDKYVVEVTVGPVRAEVEDSNQGSRTKYTRVLQIFHERIDKVVVDCQKRADPGAPDPFVATISEPAAIIENQLIRREKFNWDNVSVKSVDRHLVIHPRSETGDTQKTVRITPGVHTITIELIYNHNGWPRFMFIDMPVTLVNGRHYILAVKDNGEHHILELLDKKTGESAFQSSTPEHNKETIIPPPTPILIPPFNF